MISYDTAPVISGAWLLSGNSGTNPASNFMGSIDAEDVVFKAANTEVFRMLNSNGSLQLANNGVVEGFPSAIVCGADTTGGISLYGGPGQTGAQISVTAGSNTEPSVIATFGNAVFFLPDLSSPPYALTSPAGIAIGDADFGDATRGVLSLQTQTVNPTTIGGGGGMIFVGSDSNLYYLNSTATYQLTPLGGSNWLTSGANVGAGLLLGNADTNSWSMQSNSIPFFTVDSAQNITESPYSYSMNANKGVNFNSATSGFGVNVSDTIAFAAGGAWTASSLGFTFSPYTGGFIVNGSITSGGFSVNMPSGSASLYGYNNSSYTCALSLTIDAGNTLNLGNTNATSITIGNSSTATMTIVGLSAQTALSAVVSNTQPSGWATLIINTTTNQIAYYVQT